MEKQQCCDGIMTVRNDVEINFDFICSGTSRIVDSSISSCENERNRERTRYNNKNSVTEEERGTEDV